MWMVALPLIALGAVKLWVVCSVIVASGVNVKVSTNEHSQLVSAHYAPSIGHLGREKTFLQVSEKIWWPHL